MSELLYSLPVWDLQNLGIINPDMSLGGFALTDESAEPFFSSPSECSDVSTGYLEDVLMEFGERRKRRRLSFHMDDQTAGFNDITMGSWGLSENFSCMSQFAAANGISDERKSTSVSRISFEEDNIISSSSSKNSPVRINSQISKHPTSCSELKLAQRHQREDFDKKDKKPVVTGSVAYPFALVKPGGREDDVTLNDINERILMPPTRPVRHPVGDFACRPSVSADGPGLSGKAVVALTRIQTHGRGTITIIRTKG